MRIVKVKVIHEAFCQNYHLVKVSSKHNNQGRGHLWRSLGFEVEIKKKIVVCHINHEYKAFINPTELRVLCRVRTFPPAKTFPNITQGKNSKILPEN